MALYCSSFSSSLDGFLPLARAQEADDNEGAAAAADGTGGEEGEGRGGAGGEDDESATASADEEKRTEDSENDSDIIVPPKPVVTKDESGLYDDFDPSSTDWGTYYDPQNVFCGKYDCYKILGFDYESFDRKNPPSTKIITKRYRALSREWHPDKSKHRDAKNRFVKISRAYEVLTNAKTRNEYDEMRYDMEKYFNKYGTSVLWSYAPKSDTTIVVLILLVIGNVASWYVQKHRWQLVADRLIKAAVEDWSPSQGGTPESKELRKQAAAALAERKENGTAEVSTADLVNSGAGGGSGGKKGKVKVSGKEKKKLEQDALRPVITEIVYQMDDFGSGFHKPTWRDLLVVSLARLPFKLGKELYWFTKYYGRRAAGYPLSDEERLVLTQRAVGPLAWDHAPEETRQKWIARELWIVANLAEWSEEQEIMKMSPSDRKEYLKMKKKGLLNENNLMKEE